MRKNITIGLGIFLILASILPLANAAWSSRNIYHAMVHGYMDMEDYPTRKVVSPRTGFATTAYENNGERTNYRYGRTALNNIIDNKTTVQTQIAAVINESKQTEKEFSEKMKRDVDSRNTLYYDFRIQPSVVPSHQNDEGDKVITDVKVGDQIDFIVDPVIAETWGNLRFNWEYQRDRIDCQEINARHLTCLVTDEYPSVVAIRVTLMDRDTVPRYSFRPNMVRIIPKTTPQQPSLSGRSRWY